MIINGTPVKVASNPAQGHRTVNAAQPEAIPFPPRNLVYRGQTCPTIADSPTKEWLQMGVSTICIAKISGRMALAISSNKTMAPYIGPHVLATLVAPVLPLPYCLMSIFLTYLPIIRPKEIEAIR